MVSRHSGSQDPAGHALDECIVGNTHEACTEQKVENSSWAGPSYPISNFWRLARDEIKKSAYVKGALMTNNGAQLVCGVKIVWRFLEPHVASPRFSARLTLALA
jgi:hypothetical protein